MNEIRATSKYTYHVPRFKYIQGGIHPEHRDKVEFYPRFNEWVSINKTQAIIFRCYIKLNL